MMGKKELCLMVIVGQVSRNEVSEQKDKEGNPYINFAIEGFDLIPANGVSLPERGLTVKAHVSTHYRQGARPLHFLQKWSEANF